VARSLKDQIVALKGPKWQCCKGWTLRRVEAWVTVDEQPKLMVFITNNSDWSASSVCDLYRARWDIEVFFKQVANSNYKWNGLGRAEGWRDRNRGVRGGWGEIKNKPEARPAIVGSIMVFCIICWKGSGRFPTN
jgi:hypothetical protein